MYVRTSSINMGCMPSKPNINDIHPNIFNVLNIDEEGNRKFEGLIKVTEHHLELTQKGQAPIRWPLKSLRKYGYKTEVFTFESGRRGPTGVGIYAFRCTRAQKLFNLLQSNVKNTSLVTSTGNSDITLRRSSNDRLIGGLNNETNSNVMEREPSPVLQMQSQATNGEALRQANVMPAVAGDPDTPVYINLAYPNGGQANSLLLNADCPVPNVPPPRLPPNVTQNSSSAVSADASLLSRRAGGASGHPPTPLDLTSAASCYENVTPSRQLLHDDEPALPPKPLGRSVTNTPLTPQTVCFPPLTPTNPSAAGPTSPDLAEVTIVNKQVNYAQLDLNTVPVPPTEEDSHQVTKEAEHELVDPPTNGTISRKEQVHTEEIGHQYATIDFDCTEALTNTARLQSKRATDALAAASAAANDDPVPRRARHNSTLPNLPSLVLGGKRNSVITAD